MVESISRNYRDGFKDVLPIKEAVLVDNAFYKDNRVADPEVSVQVAKKNVYYDVRETVKTKIILPNDV